MNSHAESMLKLTDEELSEIAFHSAIFPRLYAWFDGGSEALCKMCANIITMRAELV